MFISLLKNNFETKHLFYIALFAHYDCLTEYLQYATSIHFSASS